MLFDFLFLGVFIFGWLACAYLPWLMFSVASRGNAGLGRLPLALFGGLVGALAVPLFGLDNATGLWLSFLVAFLVSGTLVGLARLAQDGGIAAPHEEPPPGLVGSRSPPRGIECGEDIGGTPPGSWAKSPPRADQSPSEPENR